MDVAGQNFGPGPRRNEAFSIRQQRFSGPAYCTYLIPSTRLEVLYLYSGAWNRGGTPAVRLELVLISQLSGAQKVGDAGGNSHLRRAVISYDSAGPTKIDGAAHVHAVPTIDKHSTHEQSRQNDYALYRLLNSFPLV